MTEILAVLASFPTVVFTVLMVVCTLYWLMVIMGALDIDFLDFGDADVDGVAEGAAEGAAEGVVEGAAEGAAEGVIEGAAEGAAEGVIEGAAEGVAEGAAEAAAEGVAEGAAEGAAEAADGAAEAADGAEAHPGGVGAILTALRLRNAPVTVTFSFLVLTCWVLCMMATLWLSPIVSLSAALFGSLVLVGACIVAVPVTSAATAPLKRFFVVHQAPRRRTLIGKMCTVTTGRVDENFGHAEHDDGGAGMRLQVRTDAAGGLKKGQRALIVSYDKEREAFVVEPYDELIRGNGS